MEVDYTAIATDDYGNVVVPVSSVDGVPAQIITGIATKFLQAGSDALTRALSPGPANSAPSANGTIQQPFNMQRLVAIGALILGGVLLYKALAK